MSNDELIATERLARMVGGTPASGAVATLARGLDAYSGGLERPHRLAHFVAQIAHESAGLRYDTEIWGPTDAQRRYEGRADLGNTRPGDGKRFMGRTAIMLTGRGNYAAFARWARARVDAGAPDFEAEPETVLNDPWEGLGPVWYWHAGNPSGRSLDAYADDGDFETITERVNGGHNGWDDRRRRYARAALALLDRPPDDLAGFQRDANLVIDAIPGPRTRAALHERLKACPPLGGAPKAPSPLSRLLALLTSLLGGHR